MSTDAAMAAISAAEERAGARLEETARQLEQMAGAVDGSIEQAAASMARTVAEGAEVAVEAVAQLESKSHEAQQRLGEPPPIATWPALFPKPAAVSLFTGEEIRAGLEALEAAAAAQLAGAVTAAQAEAAAGEERWRGALAASDAAAERRAAETDRALAAGGAAQEVCHTPQLTLHTPRSMPAPCPVRSRCPNCLASTDRCGHRRFVALRQSWNAR